jgi:hypothetical protein
LLQAVKDHHFMTISGSSAYFFTNQDAGFGKNLAQRCENDIPLRNGGEHKLNAPPAPTNVAVKIIDMLGEEALVIAEA